MVTNKVLFYRNDTPLPGRDCRTLSKMLNSLMRKVAYTRHAQRALERIPANVARNIRDKIAQYAADPQGLANNVKALKGKPGFFRLRVGDWRIVFRPADELLEIVDIGPRGSIYE